MTVFARSCGVLSANMYLVSDDCGNAVVIDPIDAKILDAQLQSTSLSLKAILLTHGHFDHASALRELSERYGVPSYIGELDRDLLHHPDRNASFLIGQPVDLGNCSDTLSDGDVLKVGNLVITVHHTPGHTMGSVMFAIENALFTGDTLFKGGIGRCDLYGGDPSQMRQSLLKITAMDPLLRVYPGHGVSTTLDRELSCNPYLSF